MAQKIAKFAHVYLICTAEDPGGADGNLLTNYVDDGMDENDVSPYSDEELHDRFQKLLELYENKKQKGLKGITPESDEIPELIKDMGRTFFGVDFGSDH